MMIFGKNPCLSAVAHSHSVCLFTRNMFSFDVSDKAIVLANMSTRPFLVQPPDKFCVIHHLRTDVPPTKFVQRAHVRVIVSEHCLVWYAAARLR